MGVDRSYYVSFSFLSFIVLLLSFSFMAKPPIALPSFSHFAEASSPFLHLAMCSFSESSKKSEEQEEEASP